MDWLNGGSGGFWWMDKTSRVLVSRGDRDRVSVPQPGSPARLHLDLHTDPITIAQDRKMSKPLLDLKKNSLPYSRPLTPEHGRRVGIYGLGAIGYHVARNLANSHSTPLVVYNRTPAKSEKLANELGPNKISIVESPAELVNSCDIMYALLVPKLAQGLIRWH